MRYRQYKFKFYINASHAISIGGELGGKHPHTWEIGINILKLREDFVAFDSLEERMEALIERYQNTFLNEIPPFTTVNPTLENCCYYFKTEIEKLLSEEGWRLLMIEMSETPTRSYVINVLDEEEIRFDEAMDVLAEGILEDMIRNRE